MDFEEIWYEVDEGIATITFFRPEKLNAQTAQMTDETRQALIQAGEDDSVRAVIVTGAGRAFCAGSDMSPRPQQEGAPAAPRPDGANSITMTLYDFPKPVIAAINGAAVGFGVSSTLAMDIRISSTAGRFGFVYSQRGIPPESASTWFLPRLVGVDQALRWMYSGKVFGADEALAGGLVSEVVEPDQLMPRAREIAHEIATQTSPIAIALIRQLIWKMQGAAHPLEAQQIEGQLTRELRGSPDGREGIVSFLEQRAPNFVSKVTEDMPPSYPWWDRSESS